MTMIQHDYATIKTYIGLTIIIHDCFLSYYNIDYATVYTYTARLIGPPKLKTNQALAEFLEAFTRK